MGTRNIRIMRSQVSARLSEIDGRVAHVVLRNGMTFTGKVIETGPDRIRIRDANARWTSLRRHTHTIELDEIMEVILDTVTEF